MMARMYRSHYQDEVSLKLNLTCWKHILQKASRFDIQWRGLSCMSENCLEKFPRLCIQGRSDVWDMRTGCHGRRRFLCTILDVLSCCRGNLICQLNISISCVPDDNSILPLFALEKFWTKPHSWRTNKVSALWYSFSQLLSSVFLVTLDWRDSLVHIAEGAESLFLVFIAQSDEWQKFKLLELLSVKCLIQMDFQQLL